jgi:hypothetical protein
MNVVGHAADQDRRALEAIEGAAEVVEEAVAVSVWCWSPGCSRLKPGLQPLTKMKLTHHRLGLGLGLGLDHFEANVTAS